MLKKECQVIDISSKKRTSVKSNSLEENKAKTIGVGASIAEVIAFLVAIRPAMKDKYSEALTEISLLNKGNNMAVPAWLFRAIGMFNRTTKEDK